MQSLAAVRDGVKRNALAELPGRILPDEHDFRRVSKLSRGQRRVLNIEKTAPFAVHHFVEKIVDHGIPFLGCWRFMVEEIGRPEAISEKFTQSRQVAKKWRKYKSFSRLRETLRFE